MLAILSPAKRMKTEDCLAPRTEPMFLARTEQLLGVLRGMTLPQLQTLLQCNDDIARRSWRQYQTMDLRAGLSPAVLSFDGIQYPYMAPGVFDDRCFDYIERHVRILSGFYGILRPFDGIIPYRLELKTQMTGFKYYSLYNFWKDLPYQELFADTDTVINLASLEYSRLISPYLKDSQKIITIKFLENKNGKWRQSATHAKMARGEMVRFAAKEGINRPEDLKEFSDFGYVFSAADSSKENYIFKKL